jgi:hypothetical protein
MCVPTILMLKSGNTPNTKPPPFYIKPRNDYNIIALFHLLGARLLSLIQLV